MPVSLFCLAKKKKTKKMGKIQNVKQKKHKANKNKKRSTCVSFWDNDALARLCVAQKLWFSMQCYMSDCRLFLLCVLARAQFWCSFDAINPLCKNIARDREERMGPLEIRFSAVHNPFWRHESFFLSKISTVQ